MKHIFKKPSFYLISSATDGDEKAIEKILALYDPYISKSVYVHSMMNTVMFILPWIWN